VKAAEKAENARLARERGWCDSDISDDLAAKIYRGAGSRIGHRGERSYPAT
jgi:hypothetical protein